MASLVFGNVSAAGYIGFSSDLTSGDWALIDISPYDGPNRTALKDLGDAPACVLWKLQLAWVIGAVVTARDGAGSAKECDRVWDDTQKDLSGLLGVAGRDKDPQKRAASERLHKLLTKGAGAAQTKLSYQQEVDFGRQQVKTTSSDQPAADVALLGLGPTMKEIGNATEALADAIAHGQSGDRPSERVRAVTAECSAVFGQVSATLAWVANNGAAGADRQRATKLLETLAALVARYPAPAASAPAAAAPAAAAPAAPAPAAPAPAAPAPAAPAPAAPATGP